MVEHAPVKKNTGTFVFRNPNMPRVALNDYNDIKLRLYADNGIFLWCQQLGSGSPICEYAPVQKDKLFDQ